jgi:putative flippase GtrA
VIAQLRPAAMSVWKIGARGFTPPKASAATLVPTFRLRSMMPDASRPVRRSERPSLFALAARAAMARAPKGLVRFLTVGVGGLAVDLAVLSLLERAGLGHPGARAVSLVTATLVTWTLNRRFTFGDSGRRAGSELGRYAVVAGVAQSVNFLVFLGLLAAWPHLMHQLAAFVGAVVATAFSYTGQRFFTFAPEGEAAAPALGEAVE